jgi:SAM-dependent methyltransferase
MTKSPVSALGSTVAHSAATKTADIRDGLAHSLWLARLWVLRRPQVQRIRASRYGSFVELVELHPRDSILDVGCAAGTALEAHNTMNQITGLDLRDTHRERFERYSNVHAFVVGDACAMPFGDREFDVVFSNSVIEHIARERRHAMANEIRRVGRRYFVQTPNRWFPLEPHYMIPFFQFFPRRLRHYYDRRFHDDQIDLLSARELRQLFSDADIYRERFLGLTKSLFAVRREPTVARSDAQPTI